MSTYVPVDAESLTTQCKEMLPYLYTCGAADQPVPLRTGSHSHLRCSACTVANLRYLDLLTISCAGLHKRSLVPLPSNPENAQSTAVSASMALIRTLVRSGGQLHQFLWLLLLLLDVQL